MNWITGFAAFLLVVGVTAGLLLGGLNPWTDPAEAQGIYNEVENQRKLDELEYEKLTAQNAAEIAQIEAKKQAELDRIEAEKTYQREYQARQLEAYELRSTIMNGLLAFGGVAFIMIASGYVIVLIRRTVTTTATPARPLLAIQTGLATSPARRQNNPSYKILRINARQRELLLRHLALQGVNIALSDNQASEQPQFSHLGMYQDPARMSSDQYQNLPRV